MRSLSSTGPRDQSIGSGSSMQGKKLSRRMASGLSIETNFDGHGSSINAITHYSEGEGKTKNSPDSNHNRSHSSSNSLGPADSAIPPHSPLYPGGMLGSPSPKESHHARTESPHVSTNGPDVVWESQQDSLLRLFAITKALKRSSFNPLLSSFTRACGAGGGGNELKIRERCIRKACGGKSRRVRRHRGDPQTADGFLSESDAEGSGRHAATSGLDLIKIFF